MLIGLLCALGAGLLWGGVFVAPLILPEYPGMVLSCARYIAFGLIALVPAIFDRKNIKRLARADWVAALKLSLVGNLLYYAALATAIQLAGAPLPTMLIGTLPVVISLFSNWTQDQQAEKVAWRRLTPSLLIIFTGIFLVNDSELRTLMQHGQARQPVNYLLGGLFALVAVAAWTWYPIMNSRYLKAHPSLNSSTWATAQGLATLPLAGLGFVAYGLLTPESTYAFPFGPQPKLFIGVMLLIGFAASWLGTLLWNQASQRLPTSLTGQLIVFETISALAYAFALRGSAPPLQVLLGISLLCIGVLLGARCFHRLAH